MGIRRTPATLPNGVPVKAAAVLGISADDNVNVDDDDDVLKKHAHTMTIPYSKKQGERFFLLWAVVWVSFMAFIVISRAFEKFDQWSYLYVGLIIAVPPIIGPLLFPKFCDDPNLPWQKRYTTKANLWVFVFAFIGNYLWTHYFYTVLGCSYTFPAHRINDVPIALFLITHGYFLLYHVLATKVIRILWKTLGEYNVNARNVMVVGAAILGLSYSTAFLEAFTIQNFQYYVIPNKLAMYVVGSAFYAIYFIVSFPMFYRLDERPGDNWTLSKTFFDSMAACMIVTMILDAWRISFGSLDVLLAKFDGTAIIFQNTKTGLPWLQ